MLLGLIKGNLNIIIKLLERDVGIPFFHEFNHTDKSRKTIMATAFLPQIEKGNIDSYLSEHGESNVGCLSCCTVSGWLSRSTVSGWLSCCTISVAGSWNLGNSKQSISIEHMKFEHQCVTLAVSGCSRQPKFVSDNTNQIKVVLWTTAWNTDTDALTEGGQPNDFCGQPKFMARLFGGCHNLGQRLKYFW